MKDKEKQCQKILDSLENVKTKIKLVGDIKGSYYAYITDTIYLSNNNKKTDEEELVILCHESVHSVQSKKSHMLNFILSNLEIAISLILILLLWFKNNNIILVSIIYSAILLATVIVRILLENEAVVKSFILAKEESEKEPNIYKKEAIIKLENKAHKNISVLYISLFWKKTIKILFMIALYNFVK